MSDTWWVAAGTHKAMHKRDPSFRPCRGLQTVSECISDLASVVGWRAIALHSVGSFTHAGLNTQDFIKSINTR